MRKHSMDTKRTSSTYLLIFGAILLMNTCVVDSTVITDTVINFAVVNASPLEYIVVVEVNVSQVILQEQIKNTLDSLHFPLQLDNTTEISSVNITTVCQPNGTNYQCACEQEYVWSYSDCVAYDACDDFTAGTCGCVRALPSDGQMCVPKNELFFDFLVEMEFAATSNTEIKEVKNVLEGFSFPILVGNRTEVTDVKISTVCVLNNTGFNCKCEDQYFWPCDKCVQYGHCDDITNATCGCLNDMPTEGQFCQPITEITNVTCPDGKVPTEYMLEIKIDTNDARVLNYLRNVLTGLRLPFSMSDIQITELNFTTVCLFNNTGYQCSCEDQYLWPCEKCTQYGYCNNITTVTCGCISALPYVGQFCQPVRELTNPTCPEEPVPTEYMLEIKIDTNDARVLNYLRNVLTGLRLPFSMSDIQITELNFTTVCLFNNTGYQCSCEDQYLWPCEKCTQYGYCNNITTVTCGCISALPDVGQFCQPVRELTNPTCPEEPVPTEYMLEIKIDTNDARVLNYLRNVLTGLRLPFSMSDIQITELNFTTVCLFNNTGYQCSCEDQYLWPCEKCTQYGYCNNITTVTCGCISALPDVGQFCQPVRELTNPTCPEEPVPTEYMLEIKIDTNDARVLNYLRNVLTGLRLPFSMSDIQITELNFTTVCLFNNTGYQCSCEDQYLWPCEKCTQYGYCNNITTVTCGCISALPDVGQFCQPVRELTNPTCPEEPVPTEYMLEIKIDTNDAGGLNYLRNVLTGLRLPFSMSDTQITELNFTTVCLFNNTGYQCSCEDQYLWPCEKCTQYGYCNNITTVTCGCISALPYVGQFCQPVRELTNPTCPEEPVPTEYMLEIKIDTNDARVLNYLRNVLTGLRLPFSMSDIQITELNFTTVCLFNNTGYQCSCEDQYLWPCEKCTLYGYCNNITTVTCGCISALPDVGQFCQPVRELTNPTCPEEPVPTEYMLEIKIDTNDARVLNYLRNVLTGLRLPFSMSDIQITELNFTTVCLFNNTGYQCSCEDQYLWPCEKCTQYGYCNNITTVTCGCISALPDVGQFCQPVRELTNPTCPEEPVPTEYMLEIKIDTNDAGGLNYLRNVLTGLRLPFSMSDTQITELNFTTVCLFNNTGYQCSCEDQYLWPCEKCTQYGYCNNITTVTCGCISALPDVGQFCQPVRELTNPTCPEEPVPTEYMLEIKIDTNDAGGLNYLRNVLTGLRLPFSMSDTQITELNFTTVCLFNNTGYQCSCEDQYLWPCEKCTQYGYCNNITTVTCGCISALPDVGHFCQPVRELTNPTCPEEPVPTEYMLEIKIDTNDAGGLNYLRNVLTGLRLPFSMSDTQITELNFTTVCLFNNTGYQCSCEDQYLWPCEKCTQYGYCNNITTVTCGCISALPDVGQFCQPVRELTNPTCPEEPVPNEYMLEIKIDTNDAGGLNYLRNVLTGLRLPFSMSDTQITELKFTTVCLFNNTGYQCSCEDQYLWPCEKCTQYGYCNNITTVTCGCISALPDVGQFCQPVRELTIATCPDEPVITTPGITTVITTPDITTVITTPDITTVITTPGTTAINTTPKPLSAITAKPKEYTRTISLTIDEQFDNTLTNQVSRKYQTYSSDIMSSVDSVYRDKLTPYKADSVKVTRYRSGSVISDFTIVTTSNTLDFSAANRQLASVLKAKGYNVNENSFAQTVEDGLYDLRKGNIYPGKNMELTCVPPDSSIVELNWSVNDISIYANTKYEISTDRKTLTVTNTNNGDNGKYACTMNFNSIPYIIWQRMAIQPLPNVRVNSSKILNCEGLPVTLECCAEDSYTSQWSMDTVEGFKTLTDPKTGCNVYQYTDVGVGDCKNKDQILTFIWEVRDLNGNLYESNRVRLNATAKRLYCSDLQFGAGSLNDTQTSPCDADSVGNVTAVCKFNTTEKGSWDPVGNNCVLRALQELLDRAKNLQVADVPQFTLDLRNATESNSAKITESDANVLTVVILMKVIANVSQLFKVDQSIMKDFLRTSDVISSTSAQKTWERLNKKNTTQNASSELLKSVEDVGKRLTDESFGIITNSTQLNKTSTNGAFFGIFGINSTTQINLPDLNGQTLITTIVFSTLDNVLPFRNTTYNNGTNTTKLNGDVAAVLVNNTVRNISLTFDIKNTSLRLPQCVFWNFSLLDGIGGWDSTGCELKPLNQSNKFKCECNHTTSFSILMSQFFVDSLALAFITYIGVSISILCLILALIIEIIVWKPLTKNDTSYMRHVSIVNIALSLLIADICFIIGAAIVKEGEKSPVGPCSTATFFMHFFYLALFFWMLFSALLLFYRTIMVFSRMSKCVMMVIAITLGYGAPLLIAVITVASTAGGGGYIQEKNACWLNWTKTKAMLAFVIPALTIVAINLLVLIVVLYKMVRRGVGATTQPDEKHALVVIARCVAILTPLFGLTWGFGIGTMVTSALGIHIVFALLNSFQGFFILVFGILLDSKIREALAVRMKLKELFSRGTNTTSGGPSSSSGNPRSRNAYIHVSSGS